MGANDYQIGGDHYKVGKGKMEHWDLVVAIQTGYFESQVMKYIMRWRKKNGLQDLEKAQHYLAKLIENSAVFAPSRRGLDYDEISRIAYECAVEHGLNSDEAIIVASIASWADEYDLKITQTKLVGYIAEQLLLADPVPLEDSNKHAERS